MRSSICFLALLILVPQLAAAQVVISEVMYDAPGSDSKAEWIELSNAGTASVDISKWKINDGSNHVFNAPPKNGSTGSFVLAPGAYLILASDAPTFISAHPGFGVSVIDTVLSLSNTGSTISLLNASSTAVDSVTYAKDTGGNGTGESLQKVSGTFVPAAPTPGKENSSIRLPQPAELEAPSPKLTSKKTETKSISSETSTDTAATIDANMPLESAQSVPVAQTRGSLFSSPWAYGALGIAIAGAAAIFVARREKKNEWDIVEETDDSV